MAGVIDVNYIVDNLMVKERRHLNDLQFSKRSGEVQISVYSELRNLVDSFQSKINNLKDAFNTVAFKASSSNSTAIDATISSNEVLKGDHTIIVSKLAQTQSYRSDIAKSSKSSALGIAETLTFTNQADAAKKFSIGIVATDTLEMIRDKINDASGNIGISATIVAATAPDGVTPEYYLQLNAAQSGTASAFTITGDTAGAFNLTEKLAAQNAEFTFDNLSVVRSTNKIDDVLDGLDFTLKVAGQSATITIDVDNANKKDKVNKALNDMVQTYNKVIDYLDGNKKFTLFNDDRTSFKTTVNDGLPLIKSMLENAINMDYSGSGDVHLLSDLGIMLSSSKELVNSNTQEKYITTGSLEFNTRSTRGAVFTSALDNDFTAIEDFFMHKDTGFIDKINDVLTEGVLPEDDTGPLWNLRHPLDEQLRTTNRQISDENDRLEDVRSELIIKYSNLNALLSKFQQTSEYLDRQLANLGSNSNSK